MFSEKPSLVNSLTAAGAVEGANVLSWLNSNFRLIYAELQTAEETRTSEDDGFSADFSPHSCAPLPLSTISVIDRKQILIPVHLILFFHTLNRLLTGSGVKRLNQVTSLQSISPLSDGKVN